MSKSSFQLKKSGNEYQKKYNHKPQSNPQTYYKIARHFFVISLNIAIAVYVINSRPNLSLSTTDLFYFGVMLAGLNMVLHHLIPRPIDHIVKFKQLKTKFKNLVRSHDLEGLSTFPELIIDDSEAQFDISPDPSLEKNSFTKTSLARVQKSNCKTLDL